MNRVDKGLLEASYCGNSRMVKRLLSLPDKKANPNATNVDGNTPLILATEFGNIEIIRELLSAGADPNIANLKNETPLFWAVETKYLTIVKVLLSHGADPNHICTGQNDQTALHVASWYGYLKFVKELLIYRANPNLVTAHDESALDIAIRKNRTDVVEILQDYFPPLQHLSMRSIKKNRIDIPESVQDLLSW